MGRKKRVYNGVTLSVTSRSPLMKGMMTGRLYAEADTEGNINEANFQELSSMEECVIVRGERKWIPIKVDKKNGLRLTKNKETGEYRILCTLSKEKLQGMTLRNVGELEAEFGIMVEKIRL